MNKETKILLLGAGPMAIEYAKILKHQNINFITIGNTRNGALKFEEEINTKVVLGGIENWIKNNTLINLSLYKVIVTVNENILGTIAKLLISSGFKNILVEKPGGLDFEDIQSVNNLAIENKANIYIAYNRRFFSSTLTVRDLIELDGGVTSFNFEFTEWGHIIKDLVKNEGVLGQWFIQNSSHVIDLAFYIGGNPYVLKSFVKGGQSWHPNGTIFSGAGISDKNALFSYNANWESAGRWWVEFLTTENRYIMKPMEQLFVQRRGSIKIEQIELEDELDKRFKPGLYKQVEAFLNSPTKLMKIEEQIKMLPFYKTMIEGDIINI
ncbi:hypothetical protein [Flavobacterium sp.]|jgi:predicted dehydrogenase|uniref:hypothetical protein n=1 Tax=Flavobacterium sp. TaxID=239 RepID=UPI0037C10F2D